MSARPASDIRGGFSFSQMLVSLRASEAGKPFLKFSLILCFSLHLVRADLIA